MLHQRGVFHQEAGLIDATFENAAVGMAHVSFQGRWLRVNEKLLDIVGYSREELLQITFQDITHPDDLDADLEQLDALIKGDIPAYTMEKRYFHKDGGLIWINLTVGLQRDEDGEPLFCISAIEDITERKANEERLRVLVDELNHRVKNTLATVQAIAHMSFRKDEPIADARAEFTSRLHALSGAHDLLTEEKWMGADIMSVVDRALRAFRLADETRFHVAGPRIRLSPRAALTLAMAVNELATNAVKYGALSVPDGSVQIAWGRFGKEGVDEIVFKWIESNGPEVSMPDGSGGFGSTLLERILPGDFQGEAELEYAPTGLRYTLTAIRPRSADI
ncbi:sensor histidine kinase [Parasphingopyxis marina]|uniref:histidine kinase n=1 Tax=Parasphingopyxis marina TaxID=2761622 RepID=A0A842HXM4_9SPHN|nr:sensor histidine kinase [Parasphingopyxis marina]MBC2776690.1 PAS domain S-box protein [Parasphingopyxis marina]